MLFRSMQWPLQCARAQGFGGSASQAMPAYRKLADVDQQISIVGQNAGDRHCRKALESDQWVAIFPRAAAPPRSAPRGCIDHHELNKESVLSLAPSKAISTYANANQCRFICGEKGGSPPISSLRFSNSTVLFSLVTNQLANFSPIVHFDAFPN